MRILLVNKFYYQRGGDCTAVFSTERLLKDKGHDVAIFSTKHTDNVHSDFEKYFPEEVSFSSTGFSNKVSAVKRIFGSFEVANKFKQLISDFKPDVVHMHNIHSHISPIVAKIAHENGIRVVWTLHDYKLICPVYTCLRNNKTCEVCFKNKSGVMKYKCMKKSYMASMLAYLEGRHWNRKKLSTITDMFISPSAFLKTKMEEAGYLREQIEVLHNFMPVRVIPATEKDDYYCYTGRLSAEKGIDTLLEAAEKLPYRLKIIGGGPLLNAYRDRYRSDHIEFIGHTAPEKLYRIVSKARFLVIPSIWYENNPFSVIEALCLGTPVLGARIGGIPELIEEDKNGRLFTHGDITELKENIELLFSENISFDYAKIASDAYNKFSPETFYNKLIMFYDR